MRYVATILIIIVGLSSYKGLPFVLQCLRELKRHFVFWCIAGCIGYGAFYTLQCYAITKAPGWMVATTWQFTIVASLFVLAGFGKKLHKQVWLGVIVVFIGIVLVNLASSQADSLGVALLAAVPVLIASFCYPFGNQLVWEAKVGRLGLPTLDPEVVRNPFAKVMLLAFGALPLWVVLYFFVDVGVPSSSQLLNVSVVALLSGVLGTGIFLYARNEAKTANELGLVDATQASAMIFALIGEILFLGAEVPPLASIVGIVIVIAGLFALLKVKPS
ncbi:multidrug resistance efflux transporter family protein [Persicirhabdus sediminis]|uniref:multidrug resistance efflux transporter family protein n=1 Tax=Persicirhabdus sediminis TaxID=454144 RepID=UPI001F3F6035|nr:multidrug resistance efflux transporter family protein [Persicirhabdus sediminis]